MLKMVDGTGIIGLDMVCPLGGAVSPPQPPNYDNVEMEGMGSLTLQNSLKAPLERLELIGNSMQGENPAPDNPQEIKSAGRKSKNLLIENISVFTVQDNIAYIPLPEGHETKLYTMLIQKKPGENDDVGFTCGFYDKSNMTATYSAPCLQAGNLVTGNGIVNSKIGVNHFVCFSPADSRFFDIYNVMYVEGKETTLDYEPYGYFFDLKITGKNLLSNKSADWQIGKGTSWSGYPDYPVDANVPNISNALFFMNVKPSTKYTFVNKENDKLWVNRIIEREGKKGVQNHVLYQNESLNYNKYTFITKDRTTSIIFQIKKVDNTELLSTDIESNKIMFVEGEANEPTPYQPYTEQTLTLTSDRPITKWDRLVEQGGQYGWLYQSEVKEYRGEKSVSLYDSGFYFLLNNKNITKGEGYCSELKQHFPYEKNPCISFNMASNTYTYTLNTQEIYGSSVSEIKEYLKIHPLHLVYKTEATEFVPLSESEQTQLRNLHSYNGTTNIMVDSGEVECGIKLTYRKEI